MGRKFKMWKKRESDSNFWSCRYKQDSFALAYVEILQFILSDLNNSGFTAAPEGCVCPLMVLQTQLTEVSRDLAPQSSSWFHPPVNW